jgi:hypothetical protein
LLAHSSGAKQACPFGFGPHVLLAPQMLGAQQSAAPVHVTTHAAPLHFAGPHVLLAVAGALHAPRPSQTFAKVCVETEPVVESVQVCGAHSVPLVHSRQAPFPSQKPSVWHVEAAIFVHAAEGPTGTAWHVPRKPVTAHD